MDDADATGPLQGIRVVDLSEAVAGPFCTKLLGDFGADVIKVERPGGDPARGMGPHAEQPDRDDAGGLFLHVNTNKRGVVVDVHRPGGAAVVRDLVAAADVLVESGRPGALAAA